MQLQVHFAGCRRSLSGASCCIANNCAQQGLYMLSRAHAFRNACLYRTSGSGLRIASQRTPPTSGACKTFRRRAGCGLAVRTRACRCACSRAACVLAVLPVQRERSLSCNLLATGQCHHGTAARRGVRAAQCWQPGMPAAYPATGLHAALRASLQTLRTVNRGETLACCLQATHTDMNVMACLEYAVKQLRVGEDCRGARGHAQSGRRTCVCTHL